MAIHIHNKRYHLQILASISISFSVDGTGSSVAQSECKLDSGSYGVCTTPKSYSGLSDGSHTVSIRSTDAAGNLESTATLTWNIDTTAPIISLTGANPQTIELGSGYTELGATTDDGSAVTIDSSAFVDAVGSYSVLYDSTDVNGNAALQVTRTVNVVDTTAPIISLTGANPQTIELGSGYTELGATADDGSAVTIDSSAFVDAVGSYSVLYDSTDVNGNAALQVTRTVNVVDTTAPIISLTGANPQTIELGSGYTELGATANDGSAVTIDSSAFVDAVGSYSVLYDSTDVNGNAALQVTRTVNVVDTTAPIISLTGANPQTIELVLDTLNWVQLQMTALL